MIGKWYSKGRKTVVSSLLIGLMLLNVSGIVAASEDLVATSDIQPLNSTGVEEKINELYQERSIVLAQKKKVIWRSTKDWVRS